MASNTIGRQVQWGVPSALRDALDDIRGTGIVSSIEHAEGAEKTKHPDEEGDTVGVTYFDAEGGIKFSVLCTAATVKPEVGDEIAGLATALEVTGGRILVDKVTRKWETKKAKELTVEATHHPSME